MTLNFQEALSTVREKLSAAGGAVGVEVVSLDGVRGRVLAADVLADRDYPPFHRSTRDGYALRAADLAGLPATLECVGEVRAGEQFAGKVAPGQCVAIMTGAPLPAGADSVLMLEHARREGNRVEAMRSVQPFENVVRRASEAQAGDRVLPRGRRLGPSEMGLLATVGRAQVEIFREPRVAIIPTGDEIVPLDREPQWFQIRNSNAVTLTAQVVAAGGIPWRLGIAPDRAEALRKLIEEGLNADLLLMSGGVSMGKYDLVEQVLADLGAEFFIRGVAIRPGKPLMFGRVRERFFFGLPGNPVSTFVTFELFVRPAIALLGGGELEPPVFLRARLGKAFQQRLGLTAFMPARVEFRNGEPEVNLVGYQGSGDMVGVAAANCFLVVRPEQTDLAAGEWVDVLPKPG
jgi:molybdopterin molybdotransferase